MQMKRTFLTVPVASVREVFFFRRGGPFVSQGSYISLGLESPSKGWSIPSPPHFALLLGAGMSLVDTYDTFANVSEPNSVHIIMILMGNT